ncbi:hypothetical protein, partial [Sulfitobacter sp. 1A12779]|uniref:hypothetical protein n=1 Tax=Sulfitobacter sp. 1A12779 TaxID=3368599 RepID=UPI0037471C0A
MKRLSLCAFLAFGSSSAFAGPDDTTNYLMNTPVNLMDLGVFRLTLLIRDKLGSGFAAYHWDSNEIRIFLFDLPNEEMNAEAVCIEAISEIRRAANVQDGTPFSGISGFATLFKHSGYVKGTVEKNNERLMDLDKKFKGTSIFEQFLVVWRRGRPEAGSWLSSGNWQSLATAVLRPSSLVCHALTRDRF